MSIGIGRRKNTSVWYATAMRIGSRIVKAVMSGADRELDTIRFWHPVNQLPTPGIPLRLRLSNGDVINGTRPEYIERRDAQDLGYRDSKDRVLTNVREWAIR